MTIVWVLTRQRDGMSGVEDVFDTDAAARAHAEALMASEDSTVAARWERCASQFVWTIADLPGGWYGYVVSPHEVKKGCSSGIEVVTPPAAGEWTFDWACKTDGCGATLRARMADVSVYTYEDGPLDEFVVSCPICGSDKKVANAPPLVKRAAREKRAREQLRV